MLVGRCFERDCGPHPFERLRIPAFRPREPGAGLESGDLDLVGPVRVALLAEGVSQLLEPLGFAARRGRISRTGKSHRTGENDRRLGPRELAPGEPARLDRHGLRFAPVAPLERQPRRNRRQSVGHGEILPVEPARA